MQTCSCFKGIFCWAIVMMQVIVKHCDCMCCIVISKNHLFMKSQFILDLILFYETLE